MRKKPSRGRKNQLLYPLAGFGFLSLLFLAFYLGRTTTVPTEKLAVHAQAPKVSRPVPVPVPPPALPSPAPAGPVFPKGRGKIAIVLDDWGYTLKQMPALESLRRPVTVAVLPGLPHSAEVAQAAQAAGHEVILHMPMEALDKNAPREGETLLTGMPRKKVLDLLSRSLSTVPAARGISNHQGSKATSDPALMEVVMQETKRRRLYFLDSYVTNRSVCEQVARRTKIRFARRAVFLDNEQTAAGIQRQLATLVQIASEKGTAIGIGHDRPMMLSVLQKAMPALEKAGYTLVPASDLMEVPDSRSGN